MTMVFTFVPATMNPWITSGLTARMVTGRSAGTGMQRGMKANCVATSRTMAEPSGSSSVPRLASLNSPLWCTVCGLMISTLLGGWRMSAALDTTTTAMITATAAATAAPHRSSVFRISCSFIVGAQLTGPRARNTKK
jgi:hypothetical protein